MKDRNTHTATFTVRVPVQILERLDRLADTTERTRASLATRALAAYVENEESRLQAIREGIHDLDAGRAVSNEKVEAWLDSWGADNELPPPACE